MVKLLLRFLVIALAAAAFSALAADPRYKAEFEARLASVKALSSALARDSAAGSMEIKAVNATVAARQKEAEELASVGEYDSARLILNEGYKILTRTLAKMKSGTGYSGSSGNAVAEIVSANRGKASYERIMDSSRALLGAARRVNAEMGGVRTSDIERIDSLLGSAELAGRGSDYVRAESLASSAMNELRPLLASMKGSAPRLPEARDRSGNKTSDFAAFDSRMSSARALVIALRRLDQEKHTGKDVLIGELEGQLLRAESMRDSDPMSAQAMLDEAYNATKVNLQSMQTAAALKSGSAALEALDGSRPGTDARGAEIERVLKSVGILRKALDRINKEAGANDAAALAQIDVLLADARSRQASDPARALDTANEANQMAKNLLSKFR